MLRQTLFLEFRRNHHRFWGKLYAQDEIEVSWHVPSDEEIEFVVQIFREVIEPILGELEQLLLPGKRLAKLRYLKRH